MQFELDSYYLRIKLINHLLTKNFISTFFLMIGLIAIVGKDVVSNVNSSKQLICELTETGETNKEESKAEKEFKEYVSDKEIINASKINPFLLRNIQHCDYYLMYLPTHCENIIVPPPDSNCPLL